ncbi:MAG: hypothetical protein RR728_10895, partial [Oscillospiraceae bacterium]
GLGRHRRLVVFQFAEWSRPFPTGVRGKMRIGAFSAKLRIGGFRAKLRFGAFLQNYVYETDGQNKWADTKSAHFSK